MTPLALALVEDLHSELYFRPECHLVADEVTARRSLNRLVRECKFFECTAVWPLTGELGKRMQEAYDDYDRVDQRLAFLPAELTWIEFELPSLREYEDGTHTREEFINAAVLLDEDDFKHVPYYYRTAFIFIGDKGSTHLAKRYRLGYETPITTRYRIWRLNEMPTLPLINSGLKPQRSYEHKNFDGGVRRFDRPVASIEDFFHYAILSLINTPRIIGQRQHMPHLRAERDQLKKLKLVGKFPLRAWTEILLTVAMPQTRYEEPSQEAHLTGERCLHYCRTHIRVRLGMLEYVEGHWRGNPALGMKRSRYRLAEDH
jgi:hypothetical protein